MLRATEDVLAAMANCLAPGNLVPGKPARKRKLVIVLGAGCSRQYGLPGFFDLMLRLARFVHRPVDSSQDLEALRKNLEEPWHGLGRKRQREFLKLNLKGATGETCPGYVQIARLAKRGYIKAFVNMNFDSLLEEALASEGLRDKMRITTSFRFKAGQGNLVVYKPHGTIGEFRVADANRVGFTLDIVKSNLFNHPDEQRLARSLLTRHDVLVIGYSGIDVKIAQALQPQDQSRSPDYKLFVVNPSQPDRHLLAVMPERDSYSLLVTGQDAGFENFMSALASRLEEHASFSDGTNSQGETIPSDAGDTRFLKLTEGCYMTEAEQEAGKHCLDLAMKIRFSLNIAERNKKSIEVHSKETFGRCLALAASAGVCLRSSEVYLLYCVAILHDLGYYRGHSRENISENPGWNLLSSHGRMTSALLIEKFRDDPGRLKSIIPRDYSVEPHVFQRLLCSLCEYHSGIDNVPDEQAIVISIKDVKVPVRSSLLLALFVLAEDLAESHPFFPSADPIGPNSAESNVAILDPVLDLYLRGKKEFEIESGIIRDRFQADGFPRRRDWLLAMTARHVSDFDKEAKSCGAWGIRLAPEWRGPKLGENKFERVMDDALEEKLREALKVVRPQTAGEATTLLDLVALYCLNADKEFDCDLEARPREPRLALEEEPAAKEKSAVSTALERAEQAIRAHPERLPAGSLLQYYYPIRRKTARSNGTETEMEKVFRVSFEKIIYPAWRFFARNWHDRIESALMALACLEMGSSAFRSETLGGVRHLLGEQKISWNRGGDCAFGHHFGGQKCTLCTSRLLYIIVSARRLLPDSEREKLRNQDDYRGLDETARGVLRYMLSLKRKDPVWWGVEDGRGGVAVHSADYCSWAARSVAWCLAVNRELTETEGRDWLRVACGLERESVERLFEERCAALFEASDDSLLKGAEEPHSFVFGHIALACLEFERLRVEAPPGSLTTRITRMASKLQRLEKDLGPLSVLSKLFIWPVALLLDATDEAGIGKGSAERAVALCYDCVRSPVWIRGGPEAGSWGFNVKNTQSVVGSLCAFWAYALHPLRRDRFEELFESEKKRRADGSSRSAPGQEENSGQVSRAPRGKAARPRPSSET